MDFFPPPPLRALNKVLQRGSLKQPVSSAHRFDAAVLRKPCDRTPFILHYLARLHHYQSNHADRSGVSEHTNPSSLARYTKWIVQRVGLKKKKKESAWVEPYSQGTGSLSSITVRTEEENLVGDQMSVYSQTKPEEMWWRAQVWILLFCEYEAHQWVCLLCSYQTRSGWPYSRGCLQER